MISLPLRMLPYGGCVSMARNNASLFPVKLIRNLYSLFTGNGDLHGLVRCPPIASRWNRTASRICDIGCGSGDFHLDILMRINFKGIVIGVDKDYEALRRAQNLARATGLKSRVHYVCASAEQLPFRSGRFGQVFLADVVEHVANDGHVFQEAYRVMQKGALLEISTPTPLYPVVFGRRIHNAVGHVRDGYTPAGLIQEIRRYDFDVVSTKQNTGYLLWPYMAIWFRIAWKGLWDPGSRDPLVRLFYHAVLAFFSLLVRALKKIDVFGGYCSNDIEARKREGGT